jgi:hypothetical protein
MLPSVLVPLRFVEVRPGRVFKRENNVGATRRQRQAGRTAAWGLACAANFLMRNVFFKKIVPFYLLIARSTREIDRDF